MLPPYVTTINPGTTLGGEDIQNKPEEFNGALKETVGDVTDNEDLQAEGAAEKAKQTFENAKENVEGAAELEGQGPRRLQPLT